MSLIKRGVERHRFFQMLAGPDRIRFSQIGQADVQFDLRLPVGHSVLAQGQTIPRQGHIIILKIEIGHSGVVQRKRGRRINRILQRPVKRFNGLLPLALVHPHDADVIMGFGIIFLQRDGLLKLLHRLVFHAAAKVGNAQIITDLRIIGGVFFRFQKLGKRADILSGLNESNAFLQMNVRLIPVIRRAGAGPKEQRARKQKKNKNGFQFHDSISSVDFAGASLIGRVAQKSPRGRTHAKGTMSGKATVYFRLRQRSRLSIFVGSHSSSLYPDSVRIFGVMKTIN